MSIHQLLEKNNPILSIPVSKVSEDANREQIKNDLLDTMKNFNGIGLSANQIGIMERVFVMYSDVKNKETIICFDPRIVTFSDEEIVMEEGCLSYPGLWLKVSRPDGIEVTYENENGEIQEKAMFGLEARVFQHEYDHMEGTNFTKRVSRLRLDRAKKRLKKVQKKLDKSKFA